MNLNKKTWLLLFTAFITVIIVYNTVEYIDPKTIITVNKGKELPQVEMIDAESKKTVVSTDLPKNAIYYFFSPTCRYCISQHKFIEKLQKELPEVKHIGISWFKNDELSKEWIDKYAKGLFDQVFFLHSDKFAHSLDIYGVPHTLVIKNGRIEFQSIGVLKNAVIDNYILPIFM